MKVVRLLFVFLTCAMLLIGYGCTDDNVVDPGEPKPGPGDEGEID